MGVFGENDETEVHRLASKIDGADLTRIVSLYNVDDVALRSPIGTSYYIFAICLLFLIVNLQLVLARSRLLLSNTMT